MAAPAPASGTPPPAITSTRDLTCLREYNKKILGDEQFDARAAALGESFFASLSFPALSNDATILAGPLYHNHCDDISWRRTLPTPHALRASGFGKPDLLHSFLVEPCLETSLYPILHSGYLDINFLISLCSSHTLFLPLASAKVHNRFYYFRWLHNYDVEWHIQRTISPTKQAAMMACRLYYQLDTSLLMRYLRNNYTGAYRIVHDTVHVLHHHNTPERLIRNYVRVMTTGCPAKFVSGSTHANALLHWRLLNYPSIMAKLPQGMETMNKEDRNNFVIPLPHWLARFIPNLFIMPQHILERPGHTDRQIFDASRRYTWDSVPINQMTSTPHGSEEPCRFGDIMMRVLSRIYSLRCHYGPTKDIVNYANNVKLAFR